MKIIAAYNPLSKSAQELADKMGVLLVGRDINLNRAVPGLTVINWGAGHLPPPYSQAGKVINKAAAIQRAVNKLTTLKELKAALVPTVDWTTSKDVAYGYLADKTKVVVRHKLEGKDGDGVVIVGPTNGWFGPKIPDAPLYTRLADVKEEYRINVCLDLTVGVQKKVPTGALVNDVKTTGNGYGLKLLDEKDIPKGIRPVARAAVKALGLDFGGVDLVVTKDNKVLVLEVNTAPELTPSMVERYAERFNAAA